MSASRLPPLGALVQHLDTSLLSRTFVSSASRQLLRGLGTGGRATSKYRAALDASAASQASCAPLGACVASPSQTHAGGAVTALPLPLVTSHTPPMARSLLKPWCALRALRMPRSSCGLLAPPSLAAERAIFKLGSAWLLPKP